MTISPMLFSNRVRSWWRRLHAMTHKELLQLVRDVPLVLFLMYSFTLGVYISGSGITMQLRNASLLVHDADHSFASRELIHRFRAPYFRLDGEIPDPDEAMRLLDEGKAMMVLDIPPRFHEALKKGERTALQLLVDTTNAPQGLSAASYTARIVGRFGLEAGFSTLGVADDTNDRLPLVRSEHRVWFNPNQDETWYQSISHVLRMITLFGILLPAAALVREKERGTVEQLLVSPLTPFQIMFSKVLAMTTVILAFTAVALFGVLQSIFSVPMKGSSGLFFLLTALYSFATAGIGLLTATVTRNQAQVGMVCLLLVAPMVLLSGITTPFETMPEWVRALMALSPLRYYVDITFGILLKGAGMDILWKPVLAMTLLGGTLFGFGMWRFRRQFA